MGALRFSIVIPTRRGANTLLGTLRTCLDQQFDDYEVIVCDNDGPPEVRAVVESLQSPKIRYHRTPRLLPMTANWELALSLAQGEYVTALGNDDGLMLHTLREADRLITETGTRLFRWDRAEYNWPCHLSPADRNLLKLPLSRRCHTFDSRRVMQEVLRFERPYSDLPMISNGFCHRSLLDDLRARCGKLFLARAPDVYSAFTLPYLSGSFLSLDLPMAINGSSCNSNGAAHLIEPKTSRVAEEFTRLNVANKMGLHPSVPELLHIPEPHIADSFLHARQHLYPRDGDLDFDRKQLIQRCLDGIRAADVGQWNEALQRIRVSLVDVPELQSWFETTVPAQPRLVGQITQIFSSFRGCFGDYLQINTEPLGITDVYDAAVFSEKLLHLRAGVVYDLPTRAEMERERRMVEQNFARHNAELQSSRLYRLATAGSNLLRSLPLLKKRARSA